MRVLETVGEPADLKKLSDQQLTDLAAEIREVLVETVSRTGGHLGPLAHATGAQAVALVHAMFRSGALVFGGGHVVLPLLHDAVVQPGLVSEHTGMSLTR